MDVGTCHRTVATAFGELTLVGEDETLTGVYFARHSTRPNRTAFGPAVPDAFAEAARQLHEYLAGVLTAFTLDVRLPERPALHRAVWGLIAAIPRGQTRTYRELAAALPAPVHPRAVGGAVAHNPLSIIVPCHRVVGSNGSLTGYAGGLACKRALLELEGAAIPRARPRRL
jgi:methylated-DNA-[protein]-cysteine S-methyltransferase